MRRKRKVIVMVAILNGFKVTMTQNNTLRKKITSLSFEYNLLSFFYILLTYIWKLNRFKRSNGTFVFF